MDQKVLQKISYGLFVLTAHHDGKDNGCITNTLAQVASEPLTVSVSVKPDQCVRQQGQLYL